MNQSNIEPLVSICCLTYNHAPYIRDAIEGFLMQKTNFPIEILIHDDASTDGTADIIREYEAQYPDIIKPIYQTENQYSKGINPYPAFVYPLARGKYIALCEGDDYWIDPYKLQKQVDFLEANPEYGLVHTNCKKNTVGQETQLQSDEMITSGYIFKELISHEFFISTLTVCVKKELIMHWYESIKEVSRIKDWKMGDYPLWLEGSLKTKFKYLEDVTAVYRILPKSASHSSKKYKRYNFFKSVYDIKFYFFEKSNLSSEIKEKILINYYKGLLHYSRYNLKESFLGLKYLIRKKQITIRLILVYIKNLFL
jgi:glycosyltransferase involved in cell wall biosynthesis